MKRKNITQKDARLMQALLQQIAGLPYSLCQPARRIEMSRDLEATIRLLLLRLNK